MGNQQSVSSTISNTINEALTNVLINNSNQCGQNNSVTLAQNFSGIHGTGGCSFKWSNIGQEVKQTPNLACTQSAADQAQLLTDFETQLDQAASAEVSGLGGAINSEAIATSISNLKNVIKNNIDISQVATCTQNNISTATQNWNNITIDCTGCGVKDGINTCEQSWSDIRQKVVQESVANCIQSNTAIVNAINTASNEIAQETAAANTGFDIFASLSSFSLTSALIAIGVILVIGIAGFIIYKLLTRGKRAKVTGSAKVPTSSSTKLQTGASRIRFKRGKW